MEVVSLPPEMQEFLADVICMKRSPKNEAAKLCGVNGSSQLGLTQELVSPALLWLCMHSKGQNICEGLMQ